MGDKTKIEWADSSWNPTTGCTKVSTGCSRCYAETMSKRLQSMGTPKYKNGFKLTIHEDTLDIPIRWTKPRRIFVDSMSDLFHEKIPDEFILRVFDVMKKAKHHTFQVLTKRHERLLEFSRKYPYVWADNIWMGVSVENMDVRDRINYLIETQAKVKFLSCEPLLGPLELFRFLDKLDWVIVGGESGPNFRPVEKIWITDIRDQCIAKNTPFFFKQFGGNSGKCKCCGAKGCRKLDGKTYDAWPKVELDPNTYFKEETPAEKAKNHRYLEKFLPK